MGPKHEGHRERARGGRAGPGLRNRARRVRERAERAQQLTEGLNPAVELGEHPGGSGVH